MGDLQSIAMTGEATVAAAVEQLPRSSLSNWGRLPLNVAASPLGFDIRFPQRSLPAIRPAIVAGVAFTLLSGCMAQVYAQLEESLVARRAESLKGWESAMLDGKPMLEALGSRTAMLFSNYESVSATMDGPYFFSEEKSEPNGIAKDTAVSVSEGGYFEFFVEMIPGSKEAGSGTAVPVSEDGYFLTAAHNVKGSKSLVLVAFLRQENAPPKVQAVPARIVWQPDSDSETGGSALGPDIAIVHAEAEPLASLKLADDSRQIGSPVMIAGWPTGHFDTFHGGARLAAGRVLSVDRQNAVGPSPEFFTIRHDAPIVFGDSGGPVVDRKGNLIGITSSSYYSLPYWQWFAVTLGFASAKPDAFKYAKAIMPSPNWLRGVIEADRRRTLGTLPPPIAQHGSLRNEVIYEA